MQRTLGFREVADPTVPGWDELDPEARSACVAALARAIAKAMGRAATPKAEGHLDD